MIVKLIVCFCICFVVLLGAIAGTYKGLELSDSERSNIEIFGAVITIAAIVLMFASIGGVITFVIKLFILYLYGVE